MVDRNAARRPAEPPDLNAGAYPFDVVQRLVDQAAYFSLYSLPEEGAGAAPRGHEGALGIRVHEVLHPFHVGLRPPSADGGVQALNRAGPPVARFRSRWTFVPDDLRALPGRPVPAVPFDPARRQRFVMLDGELRFLSSGDGFRGFGTGATFPSPDGGPPAAAAVGTVLEGRGRFRGLSATYTYCGTLDPRRGFRGHLMLRAMDPEGRFLAPPGAEPSPGSDDPEPGTTYLLVRGQKRGPGDRTQYDLAPSGRVLGFHLEQELRVLDLAIAAGAGGPGAASRVGTAVGTMTSRVFLDILNPGAPGTDRSPVPFTTSNLYRFSDAGGGEVGRVAAVGGEGRSFNASLPAAPGQQALRFGAFQELADGAGCFRGVRGWLTDNSLVGVAPHATSTLYVLRLEDSGRRFRPHDGGA